MRAKPSGGYAFLAGTALIVLAVLVSIPAGADELVYKASADYKGLADTTARNWGPWLRRY